MGIQLLKRTDFKKTNKQNSFFNYPRVLEFSLTALPPTATITKPRTYRSMAVVWNHKRHDATFQGEKCDLETNLSPSEIRRIQRDLSLPKALSHTIVDTFQTGSEMKVHIDTVTKSPRRNLALWHATGGQNSAPVGRQAPMTHPITCHPPSHIPGFRKLSYSSS